MNDMFGDSRGARIAVGAVFGAAAALLAGLLMVLMARDHGSADLATATSTRAALLPSGAVIGALLGHHSTRQRRGPVWMRPPAPPGTGH